MDKKYYFKYYDYERFHWWFKARSIILKTYLKNNVISNTNCKILNVGAATGATTEMLSEFGDCTSIEFSKDCISFTNEQLNLNIVWGDVRKLDFLDDFFDVVCVFDVIEHIDDDELALSELLRVTKPNGSVVITVPAHMHLWSDHDLVNHHFRRYNLSELQNLIQKNKVSKIEFISYFNCFLYYPISAFRKVKNIFKSNKKEDVVLKSDFETFSPGAFFNKILFGIFLSEISFLKKRIPLPNGVSLICHLKKVP